MDIFVQLFHACSLVDKWNTKLVSVCTDINVGIYIVGVPKFCQILVIRNSCMESRDYVENNTGYEVQILPVRLLSLIPIACALMLGMAQSNILKLPMSGLTQGFMVSRTRKALQLRIKGDKRRLASWCMHAGSGVQKQLWKSG